MSTLQGFKDELFASYLQTFAYHKKEDKKFEKFNTIKKALRFTGESTDVVAYTMDQALLGKNKNSARGYSLFTKDTFYGVDINENPITFKLNSILQVISTKETKKSFFSMLTSELFAGGHSVILCKNNKSFYVAPSIGEKLAAFALINKLTQVDYTPFTQFMIDRATHLFGEIAEGSLNDSEQAAIKRIFPNGAAKFIPFHCKLKRLEIDGAYYEITIKDCDIKSSAYPDGLFSEDEWSCAIGQYISNTKILKIYQSSLKRSLALSYRIDQLHFEANVKISFSTHLKTAAEATMYSLDKMQSITEKRMIDAKRDYERKQQKQGE